MKQSFLMQTGLLLVPMLLVGFISCSQGTSDTEILKFLKKELNSPEMKKFESYAGQTGSRQVPKKKGWVVNNPISNADSFYLKEYRFYDDLYFKGLVTIKVVKEETYNNVISKDIQISLTEKGKNLLVGETTDYYYLKAFDFDGFKLISKEEKKDTITLQVKIGSMTNRTLVYDLIEKEYKQRIQASLDKIAKVKLLKTKNGLMLIRD